MFYISKKSTFLLLLLFFFLGGNQAYAETYNYGYFGTTSQTEKLWADGGAHNDVWTSLSTGGGSGQVIWYSTSSSQIGTSTIPGSVSAPSGAAAFSLRSLDGSEVYAIEGTSTNPLSSTVIFTGSSSGGGSGGSGDSGCIGCDLFNCPGWSQYMGKLDEIKSAIPPAPNWQQVANTFRDTIAPRIINDLDNLLGRAPSSPGAPNAPSAPALPSDLDDRGLTAPTGQEAPGLDDSTFSGDDIKNGAPKIPEREDPTGGFEINDPISGLPTQDEFTANQPNEGEAPLPTDPKDPDNFAPNPPEGDNIAPTPSEGDNTAPSPNEGDNYTPPNPSEPENMAPADPTEPENIAPTPGDTTGTAPIPSESGTAPIPGDTNGSAPIPSESGTAPLPGQP